MQPAPATVHFTLFWKYSIFFFLLTFISFLLLYAIVIYTASHAIFCSFRKEEERILNRQRLMEKALKMKAAEEERKRQAEEVCIVFFLF